MIPTQELQALVRQFGGPLEAAQVTCSPIAPFMTTIKGMCNLRGHPHQYECEFDRRGLDSAQDVVVLVQTLLDNMEQAATEAKGMH